MYIFIINKFCILSIKREFVWLFKNTSIMEIKRLSIKITNTNIDFKNSINDYKQIFKLE